MKQPQTTRTTHSVSVDGTSVPYHCAGTPDTHRPVLVMVHGSTGSTDSHYGYLFPLLAFRQQVVSVDLQAPAAGEQLTLECLVRQVSAVVDAVSPGRPISLMGYSLGAVVAARLAALRPDAVRNLILVAGWMKTDVHQRLRNGVWRTLRDENSAALRDYMVYCAFSPDFIAARAPHELAGMAQKAQLDGFTDQQMALNAAIDIEDCIGDIRATTLIVGCTHDQMVPKSHSQRLFGAIDDARYTQIDAGHAVVFERPAELLRLIDTFLRNPTAHAAGAIVPAAQP
jgi:pimeloyl-ACP methyl ester carboxylesterase